MTSMEPMETTGDGYQRVPSNYSNDPPKETRKKHWFFNPFVFLIITLLTTTVKTSLGGYTSGVYTTIEKRFQLKSTETGAMSIIEDVVSLSTLMFIVHFGLKFHRPRVIFILNSVIAIGAFTVSLPHFLFELPPSIRSPPVSLSTSGDNTTTTSALYCDVNSEGPAECTDEEKSTSGALWGQVFFYPLGAIIQSMGGGVGPITLTYLDDNVPKRSLALYAGAIFSVFAFGSIFGYFLSSFCLRFPVTWPMYETDYYSAQMGDANWLGAWWMGYILCSVTIILLSLPLLFFPNQMRDPHEEETPQERKDREKFQKKKLERKESRASGKQSKWNDVVYFLKDFFQSLKGVVTNPVVMLLTLSGCMEAIGISGFFLFGPKMAQIVYELSPSSAAFVTGIFLIPGAVIGQFAGGYIVKKFNLGRLGMAKMLVCSGFVLCIGSFSLFFIGCDRRPFAGISVPYQPLTQYELDQDLVPYQPDYDISSSCNKDCLCPDYYKPVCGSDGINYITACHAGCRDVVEGKNYTKGVIYKECSCIPPGPNGEPGYATEGLCPTDCYQHIIFLIVTIPTSFVATIAGICGFMLSLRSVKKNERGISMSFYNVMVKILGYIPGPLIFGAAIELSCTLYQKTCGRTGNCNIYDSIGFRFGYVSAFGLAQVLGFLSAFGCFFFVWKQTNQEKDNAADDESKAPPEQDPLQEERRATDAV